jgi:3-oxoacid CoA-transferase subunit B
MEIRDNGFYLVERAPGVSIDEIVEATDGRLIVPGDNIPEMDI